MHRHTGITDQLPTGITKPDVIVYSTTARFCTAEQMLACKAEGGTSFEAALNKITEYVKDRKPGEKIACIFMYASCAPLCCCALLYVWFLCGCVCMCVQRVSLVRRTDGEDTSSTNLNKAKADFKTYLSDCVTDLVMHTIGFGKSHCRALLAELAKLGKREGVYRYAEGACFAYITEYCTSHTHITHTHTPNTILRRQGHSGRQVLGALRLHRDEHQAHPAGERQSHKRGCGARTERRAHRRRLP